MSNVNSYDIVLKDLEEKHRHCIEEIQRLTQEQKTITQTINYLRHVSPSQQALPFTRASNGIVGGVIPPNIDSEENDKRYAGLSTRWAILCLLAENTQVPMGRSEIAKSLTDGGITSNAQSFASNVSAVLSGMAKERNEVEQTDNSGGYHITAHGREVWEGIKRTAQWNARLTSAPA